MTQTSQADENLLTPRELAAYWRVSPDHLANMRSLGRGPAFIRIGRSVRYRRSAVKAYERDGEVGAAA